MYCFSQFFLCLLRSLTRRLLDHRAHGAAGWFASLLASRESGTWMRLRWDGEDWIYRWRGGGAVHAHPFWRPAIVEELRALFLHRYQPTQGEVIVDVGVENGDEIPLFCERVGPGGRVIAIEADPTCCRRLRKLKDLLRLDVLEIVPAAVGARDGEVIFSQHLGTLANRISAVPFVQPGAIVVPQRKLPGLLAERSITRVDYLKVNIEGAELALLDGLEGSLPARHVCISCHDFLSPSLQTYREVTDWLQRHGFECSSFTPEDPTRPWQNYYVYAVAPSLQATLASPSNA
jgi:FkbM family methyltransferase